MRKADFTLGCLLGLVVAVYFYGFKIIDPYNIQWLLKGGDSYQHFIGWAFFKNDIWRWPLGLNPNFGSEIGGSIVFTDSIPLLAILLKIVLTNSSAPFQFLGFAVILNYMLTGGVLVLIFKEFINNIFICLMISLLLVSSTVMSIRGIGGHGHESLTAHWTFLYAMYLLLLQSLKANCFQMTKWTGLLVITSLIHFYFLVICLPFYVAANVQFLFFSKEFNFVRRLRKQVLGCTFTMVLLLSVMYAVGYFVMPAASIVTSEYGSYPASLLTFINPASSAWFLQSGSITSLSNFFSGFPSAIPGQYEGQAYLGAGLIILLTISSVSWLIKNVSLTSVLPLTGVCFLVSLIAVSNHVSLYDQQFVFDIYPKISIWLGMVRSSGRLIWPMFYLLVIVASYIVTKNFSLYRQFGILSVVVVVQIMDLSSWHESLRKTNRDYSGVYIDGLIKNENLNKVLIHAKSVVLYPSSYLDDYQTYSWTALKLGIPINTGLYARAPSSDFFAMIDTEQLNKIKSCNLMPNVLYVIRQVDIEICTALNIVHVKSHGALWMMKVG